MAFDNHYPKRKDKRRKYYGHKACDRTCRPGGSCPWCKGNREAAKNRAEESLREQVESV